MVDHVAGQVDSNGVRDVFLFDVSAGTNQLISDIPASATTAGNGEATAVVIDAGGDRVLFASAATDLSPSQTDTNSSILGRGVLTPGLDVFLEDVGTGSTTLMSHGSASSTATANGPSRVPRLAASGDVAVFDTDATDLLAELDRPQGTNVIAEDASLSIRNVLTLRGGAASSSAGPPGSGFDGAVSPDGRFVVFTSEAGNLVAGQQDTNVATDVFLLDRSGGTVRLVSHSASDLLETANGASRAASVAEDGSAVVFESEATDLVQGQIDANGGSDVFLFDRLSGTVALVSHSAGTTLFTGDGTSGAPSISSDGQTVAFTSRASTLVLGQTGSSAENCFAYHAPTGEVALVNWQAGSTTTAVGTCSAPRPSPDGRYVAFESQATTLVPGQGPDNPGSVFRLDRSSGAMIVVSHTQASASRPSRRSASTLDRPLDNGAVLFSSAGPDLVPNDLNASSDVFFLDPGSAIFNDGFESGDTSAWSQVLP